MTDKELTDAELLQQMEGFFLNADFSEVMDRDLMIINLFLHRFRQLTEEKPSVDEIVEAVFKLSYNAESYADADNYIKLLKTAIESVVNKTNT